MENEADRNDSCMFSAFTKVCRTSIGKRKAMIDDDAIMSYIYGVSFLSLQWCCTAVTGARTSQFCERKKEKRKSRVHSACFSAHQTGVLC